MACVKVCFCSLKEGLRSGGHRAECRVQNKIKVKNEELRKIEDWTCLASNISRQNVPGLRSKSLTGLKVVSGEWWVVSGEWWVRKSNSAPLLEKVWVEKRKRQKGRSAEGFISVTYGFRVYRVKRLSFNTLWFYQRHLRDEKSFTLYPMLHAVWSCLASSI